MSHYIYILLRDEKIFKVCLKERKKVNQDTFVLSSGSICRRRHGYRKRDADAPLSLFRGLESDWNVRTRSRERNCRLLSLVDFEAFTNISSRRGKRRKGTACAPECIHIYTGRQLKAPSRSRCRRCLRILAIFRPAASDEAARLFLLFSSSMSRATISPALRREEKWQLLGIYTVDREQICVWIYSIITEADIWQRNYASVSTKHLHQLIFFNS